MLRAARTCLHDHLVNAAGERTVSTETLSKLSAAILWAGLHQGETMSYHFPHERRQIERRVIAAPPPNGVERRLSERRATEVKLVRQREPMNRLLLWAAVFMVLIIVDSEFLDGAYRRMVTSGIDVVVTDIRSHTDDVFGGR